MPLLRAAGPHTGVNWPKAGATSSAKRHVRAPPASQARTASGIAQTMQSLSSAISQSSGNSRMGANFQATPSASPGSRWLRRKPGISPSDRCHETPSGTGPARARAVATSMVLTQTASRASDPKARRAPMTDRRSAAKPRALTSPMVQRSATATQPRGRETSQAASATPAASAPAAAAVVPGAGFAGGSM